MANPIYPSKFQVIPALAAATSANGTYRNGTTVANNLLQPGGFAATCTCTIVTGLVTATFVVQGSVDNSTFVDTDVTTTFSASGSKIITAPILPFAFLRVRCVLAGAATASGDTTTVVYNQLALL